MDFNEINQIVRALFVFYDIDQDTHSISYVTYKIMTILDLNNDDKIWKKKFINMIENKELTNFLVPLFVKQKWDLYL